MLDTLIDSFQNNAVFWMLGTSFIAVLLIIYAALTSLGLPKRARMLRVRRFALIGLGIFFLLLPLYKPYVSSYSGVVTLDELRAENLTTAEEVAKFEKAQTRQIERLKEEVKELREDVYRMNNYYSGLLQFLSTMIAVLSLNFAFRKKDEDEEKTLNAEAP